VKIKAKKIFKIIFDCVGVFGQLDCWRILMHKKVNRAKYNIYQGKKPCVRGVAKNPIDHPHGGGHGKTSGGRPSVSRWARITKGPKTKS
jgi:large subunit ribosomal protein L2